MEAKLTNDPSKSFPAWEYVPAYSDPDREYERLVRCLQQQIEDCFTTITRIEAASDFAATPLRSQWNTLRGGLRCWRAAIGALTK